MNERIGIIAGEGHFPVLLAREIKNKGDTLAVCVAIEGKTQNEISSFADKLEWITLQEFKKLIDIFINNKVNKVMLAGKLTREDFLFGRNAPSNELSHLVKGLPDMKVNTILGEVEMLLKNYSIELIDPTPYLSDHLPSEGILTNRKPDTEAQKDIKMGEKLANIIADMDIGQTVILKQGLVLAVEAIEGTDETIRRVKRFGIDGAVVVKMARTNQNMRFDIPVVGCNTIQAMKEIKASCLAIRAGKTLILDKDAFLSEADAAGISVVAI